MTKSNENIQPFPAGEIQEMLSIIIGQPLTDVRRPLWMVFEFGEQKPTVNRKGEPICRADYSLMITSDWRLAKGSITIIGYGDVSGGRRPFYARKTPPRDALSRTRWKRANEFFDLIDRGGTLIVQDLQVSPTGFLQIVLSDGYELAAIQCNSDNDDLFHWLDYRVGTSMWVHTTSVVKNFDPL